MYDLETLKRKTILGIPFEVNTREFMSLTFTHDGIHIAALTGGPDFIMYYYNWQSGKIESQAKANNPPSTPGPVTDVSVHRKMRFEEKIPVNKLFILSLNRWQLIQKMQQ